MALVNTLMHLLVPQKHGIPCPGTNTSRRTPHHADKLVVQFNYISLAYNDIKTILPISNAKDNKNPK
jgi:hypothetical protein